MAGPLPYEAALHEWMARRGMVCRRVVYARRAAGGSVVAYRLMPAGPLRALALLVHGAGNDALYAMAGLCKRLLRRGIEVFTFDMDGHGRTSTTLLAFDHAAGAVPAALEQALAGRDGLPVHGVGISLGGSFLLRALADLPGRFASAALLVAPLRIELSLRTALNELRPVALRTLWRERHDHGLWGLVPAFGPVKRTTYPLRLARPRPGAFGYVDALNELLAALALEDAARAVREPTLLAYGAADQIVPLAQGRRLAGLIQRAELMALPGETHLSTPLAPPVVERVVRRATAPESTAPR